ncbi:MAG: alpha/beta hydrolase [Chloroflexi bacterium]|nr:alpha/beta hydrolase [Chloroflexota bacterium]
MSTPDAVPAQARTAAPLPYDPARCYPLKVFDLEYRRAGDTPLLARIYQPEGPGPFPALVDIHGGQWTRGDRTGNGPLSETLAASGLVVFAPDFHLATPATPYPTALQDVNYAIRWFKAHAAEFNAVPAPLGGLGSSSGGHLIMLTAMRPRDPRYSALPLPEAPDVDAALAYLLLPWPILDPYGRFIFAQATGRDDIVASTRTFFAPWDTIWEANPVAILERGEPVEQPPALIIQGTADANVTPALQERFAAAYRAAGGTVTLEIFPDQPHQFAKEPGPYTDRARALLKEFVAAQLATVSTRA